MSNKVMIIGTGNVGASITFSLINQRTAVNELVLVDINTADAEGEAMDLRDALAVAPSYMKIKSGSYKDARGCDIIVITAGANQKPGETRLDLLKKNSGIFRPMVKEIMANGFRGIFLVITNPMDVMTYLTWKYSGLPSDHVLGSGTVLDSARLRLKLSERLNVNPKSIHAFQIGEHGDSEFALWSTNPSAPCSTNPPSPKSKITPATKPTTSSPKKAPPTTASASAPLTSSTAF